MGVRKSLAEEVAALADLPRSDLVEMWRKHHGVDPPKGVRRGLLERSAAWHLHAKRRGGLSRAAKAILRSAAREAEEAGAIAGSGGKQNGRRSPMRRPAPEPGTRLIRVWNGRTHVVDVTADGFVMEGETYRSLSVIARHITGTRWSGPRFFGLSPSGL